MDISSLIPQLFYDVIGRIIPGTTLLAIALYLFKGEDAPRYLSTWSGSAANTVPIVIVILGTLLAAHIIASLIGGIWFSIPRYGLWRLKTWGKKGEEIIDARFNKIFDYKHPSYSDACKLDEPIDKIAYMYDYVLLNCPKAGARIAKLRAEQHMSGVLMIGFMLLAALCFFLPYGHWIIAVVLILASYSAGSLAWHLEKRCASALLNLSLLAHSGEK